LGEEGEEEEEDGGDGTAVRVVRSFMVMRAL
jgi:hypothetical protein